MAFFISTQLYFNTIKNGGDPNWLLILRDQIPIWYSWALTTPLILYLVNKFPISAENVLKPFLAYTLFGMALLLVLTNLTLVYMFLTHGYIDLNNTNYAEYSPYFFSRVANDGLIYIFVLAVIISVRSYGLRRKNELDMALMQIKNDSLQNQLTQAQLQALKLQLNPHFLFNTLHTISSLTLIGENRTSASVTTRLGDFLRRTLDFEEHQFVLLSKELEFFDLYLNIESVRFKDRLVIEKEVPENCLNIKVPNLILQPLVENALKHGISKSKSASLIKLTVSKNNDFLNIEIYNDGPSIQNSNRQGIGTKNVQSRLKRLYDNRFRFEIYNTEESSGVTSILSIPINENPEND